MRRLIVAGLIWVNTVISLILLRLMLDFYIFPVDQYDLFFILQFFLRNWENSWLKMESRVDLESSVTKVYILIY